MLTGDDWLAIWVTIKLALTTVIVLMLIGTPVAWWLAKTKSRFKEPISAVIALPLVLPPTVLGFYLLVFLSPQGNLGQALNWVGIGTLPFTFEGIVLASVIYSFPFVVQPLQNTFESIGSRPLEVAATLGANKWDSFFSVIVPMSRPGFISAAVLGFAHTLGEFGVILMMGGNIPGVTRVLSVQIYDHVEALNYTQAHWLSGLMLISSFIILLLLYSLNRQSSRIGLRFR